MKLIRHILSNLLTLLLAFALALLIWIRASQLQDPVRNQSIQIPIEFVNKPEPSVLVSPDSRESVQISFSGPASVVNQLTAEDFSATVDLSDVPFGRELPVDIDVQQESDEVEMLFKIPEQIDVHLEQVVTRDVPVVLDIRGSVARGHSQGEALVEPPAISVEGSASRVESLDFARVTIFLNNARENVVESPQPIFYDRQGRVASVGGLDLSTEQVEVTIPINESAGFAEKLITVDWVGEPAIGYRLLSVDVEPPSVLVRGRPTQLNALNRVQTEEIDIAGLTESFRQQVTLDLPEGITLAEVEEIFVDIEIQPILTTDTYNRVPELQGLGNDLAATIEPDDVRVFLFGPLPVLDALSGEEVRVTIDLFGLVTGTYSLEPEVDVPDRGIEVRSVEPPLVTVEITRALTVTNGVTETRLSDPASFALSYPVSDGQRQERAGDDTTLSLYHFAHLPKRIYVYEL